MKALIFNSGIGKRMGELTAHSPKSMVHLYNDETIFERQIRLIQEAGIKEVIVTTGPYPEMLKDICAKPCYQNMKFYFPHNEKYDHSNYIYSMYKAREYLDDDIIMMHGDLVFDREILPSLLKDKKEDICLINKFKALPEKDFKGRIVDGTLREVSVKIFDKDCFAFQPLYKLSKSTIKAWSDNVVKFIESGNDNVYAENALNEISDTLKIYPKSYANHFVDEVDNPDDLKRVSACIEQFDFKDQKIYQTNKLANKVKKILDAINAENVFIVVDKFFTTQSSFKKFAKALNREVAIFSNFTSNPKYEEMIEGLNMFKANECDTIISLGGGSCIDVAKTIKLSLNADVNSDIPTFKQEYKNNTVRHICIPTTSGTGSESTRHAVIYLDSVKQSICNSAILPEYVVLNPNLVLGVPTYQRMATCLDALSQCIESNWSKKATKVSRKYARKGYKLFLECYKDYMNFDLEGTKKMQLVANLSGKGINISETTAGHALSYNITKKYNIPHGHAVAMCLNAIFNNVELKRYADVKDNFQRVLKDLNVTLTVNSEHAKKDIKDLTESVNLVRLANFPKKLSKAKIKKIYSDIVK